MNTLKALLTTGLVLFGTSGIAFAGWTPILTLNTPAHGRQYVDQEIFTDGLKVVKEGQGCILSYQAVGRLIDGREVYLNLLPQGSSSDRGRVYQVNPTGTIFSFDLSSQGPASCTYTFYAKTID